MKKAILYTLALFTLLLIRCRQVEEEPGLQGRLKIVATTGFIADAVKNIVKDSADVIAIMGPGVDPHMYKATQGDLKKLMDAQLIFYNGLHLEGKMGEVMEKLSRHKTVIAVTEAIEKERLIADPNFQGNYDPHIWFDASLWKEAVNKINQSIQQKDTARAEYYGNNAKEYLNKLDSLHLAISLEIQKIPEAQRVLVTSHDAFSYFGRAYNIGVKSLLGTSTIAEYGLKDVSNLVNFIMERNIQTVYTETSVSEKAIAAVVAGARERGHKVSIGSSLYSDALGASNTPEGTYIGMMDANLKAIMKGLHSEQ